MPAFTCRARVLTLLFLLAGLASQPLPARAGGAPAQDGQLRRGVVVAETPVFLRPDASLTPLRRLPAGTPVTVDEVRDQWVQVTFIDARFGRRTGWIARPMVSLDVQAGDPAAPPAGEPPAAAAPQPVSPAEPSSPGIGLRGFGTAAIDRMAAGESFDAVFGTRSLPSYGGGIQVTNLWRGLFLEVSAERSRRDGERVFVSGGTVFPLGIPVQVTQTPVDLVAGWRTPPVGVLRTYAGAGVTWFTYEETSSFAGPGEDVDERYEGWVALGGVEVQVARWLHVRGEARYRRVDDALGAGGVSAEFGETRLGGFGAALKIAVGR